MLRAFVLFASACIAIAADRRIPVRVVVVTMFERGADTGDTPGEFQFWVEREKLTRVIPFPQGDRNLRMNTQGVLGLSTGVGTAKAAASMFTARSIPASPAYQVLRVSGPIVGGANVVQRIR